MYYAKSNEKSFEQSICYLDRAKNILNMIKNIEEYTIYDLEIIYHQGKDILYLWIL